MRRAPVRVETKKLLFDLKSQQWTCDARLQAAEFQNRQQPEQTAIVHRSTKRAGWQTSYFDERGAASDVQSSSCQEALRALPPKLWRLRNVSPKR